METIIPLYLSIQPDYNTNCQNCQIEIIWGPASRGCRPVNVDSLINLKFTKI